MSDETSDLQELVRRVTELVSELEGVKRRRWYQYSLKTLLVVVLLSCLAFAWIGWRMQRARTNRDRVLAVEESVDEIEKLGGYVESKYKELRPRTWLEQQFDDPGGPDSRVGVLNVERVSFQQTVSVTDADLEHLKGLTELQSLDLSGNNDVTDAGMEYLKGLTDLRSLSLGRTKVTDAGLEHLTGMTKLRVLTLYGANVTDEGVKKLQQALPNCDIHHRSGYYLAQPDE